MKEPLFPGISVYVRAENYRKLKKAYAILQESEGKIINSLTSRYFDQLLQQTTKACNERKFP